MPYFILCLCLSTLLAGCNTIEGLGNDIAKGGEAISHAAAKDKK